MGARHCLSLAQTTPCQSRYLPREIWAMTPSGQIVRAGCYEGVLPRHMHVLQQLRLGLMTRVRRLGGSLSCRTSLYTGTTLRTHVLITCCQRRQSFLGFRYPSLSLPPCLLNSVLFLSRTPLSMNTSRSVTVLTETSRRHRPQSPRPSLTRRKR